MTRHTYSVPAEIGGLEGWFLWDCRLQSYAAVLRLFDGPTGRQPHYPPSFSRHGTRPLEYPTPEALVNDLVARGLSLAPRSRAAIDGLACSVEAEEGPVELVGLTDGVGRRRLYYLAPSGSIVELLPQFSHPEHGFQWGDRSPASYDTALIALRSALGPTPAEDLDVAAMGLVVEFLVGVDDDFSLSAPGLCAWFLADAPLVATLCPTERRSLHRRLGLGTAPRSPVEESSAAATPAGAGWAGLDGNG